MTSYAERKAESELLFRATARESITETTPPALTPKIAEFCASLSSEAAQFVPVVADGYGLYGYCSDGVEEKMRHDGGSIRYGWTLWEYPKLFLTAEFHAVWVDSTGDLQDITPKPHRERRILFVPDSSFLPGFNFDDRPLSRRVRLYEPKVIDIVAMIADMPESQRRYEERRAAKVGKSLAEWLQSKQPADNRPAIIDDFLAACAAHDAKQDTFPGTMFVPDDEFMELMDRKDEALHRLRTIRL